jgi:hypothetical protein
LPPRKSNEIEARRQASGIIIAAQGRWYTASIRPFLCVPDHHLLLVDYRVKVLGSGTTDPITGMIADWTGMIVTITPADDRSRR